MLVIIFVMKLIIKQFEIGPLQNFIYFLADADSKEVAVVDPAWDVGFLLQEAKKENWKITKFFLTHGHPDHVNGLPELLKSHDVPVYISENEAPFLKPKNKNIIEVKNGETLTIGSIPFKCILTPGHTPGCQCFLHGKHLITGDALFIDGCGRCDLPGGDAKRMYNSLYKIIMPLPDETIVYPGHNYGATPTDTIGHQKESNPYLQCENMQEFLSERMGY